MTFTTPVAITDPFTTTYNSVAKAIKFSPSVQALVISDNIVDDLDYQPQIDYRQAGDLPALLIIQDTSSGDNLWSSSTTADFETMIVFRLMTGDERIGLYLNPMRWAISRALVTAGIKLGDPNVVSYNLTSFTVTNRPDETTDISERGWIAEMTMSINMCICHSTITE